MRPRRRRTVSVQGAVSAAAVALICTACGPIATAGPGCDVALDPVALPADLEETSGIAASVVHEGLYWTHPDAGSVLYGVNESGREIARFPLPVQLRDWEDLALSRCTEAAWCLYAADVGDNYEERPSVALVRIPEPDPEAPSLGELQLFPIRFPDGPRDVEALLVLPGERVLLVTKGRNHPVTAYRYPGQLRPDTVTLEEVQRLSESPRILPRQITGGSLSRDGQTAVLRTYQSLQFFGLHSDTLVPARDGLVNLRTLQEPQGEGVALGPDGQVILTSEGGPGGGPGSMAMLRCRGLGG